MAVDASNGRSVNASAVNLPTWWGAEDEGQGHGRRGVGDPTTDPARQEPTEGHGDDHHGDGDDPADRDGHVLDGDAAQHRVGHTDRAALADHLQQHALQGQEEGQRDDEARDAELGDQRTDERAEHHADDERADDGDVPGQSVVVDRQRRDRGADRARDTRGQVDVAEQ